MGELNVCCNNSEIDSFKNQWVEWGEILGYNIYFLKRFFLK